MGALRYSLPGQDLFLADEALGSYPRIQEPTAKPSDRPIFTVDFRQIAELFALKPTKICPRPVDLSLRHVFSNSHLPAPPITRIAELQAIAFELTKKKLAGPDKIKEWLKVLVAPGSSLGGARPKANLVDDQGQLWIAKFPSSDDDYNVAVWEKVVHDLARDCGISVPESKLIQIGDGYHTFLVQRFDRNGENRRFFSSAMTLINHVDTDEASYLELAEFLATFGNPDLLKADLEELFTRVVFNVVTANRDDHLRNHGFMRSPAGWRLAPAFDINPSFKKEEHALALDLNNHQPDLEIVRETAGYYRLNEKNAEAIIQKVCKTVASWKQRAIRYGLSRQECLEAEHLFNCE
ncbi:MAG: HipA domain-containing protein [Desulfuromonas sp.]|nr:HipA domain-containing protein [Desulfuromonas sp.]